MREYILVFAVILIGLIPSFFTYHYLNKYSWILTSFEGGTTQALQVQQPALSAAVAMNNSSNAITDVYQSRPQKETTGLCTHSYYMSFTLALAANGKFSLMKRCESARDPSFTWYGVASTTWTTLAGEGTIETRGFSITSDEHGTYEKPIYMMLSRQGDDIKVFQTELREIATTTAFARVP